MKMPLARHLLLPALLAAARASDAVPGGDAAEAWEAPALCELEDGGCESPGLSMLQRRGTKQTGEARSADVARHEQAPADAPKPAEAPLFEFYLYRAQSDVEYPVGNVNAGNLPGVMWYLTNEVAAYSTPCHPRYNITRIRRFLIRSRTTPELFAQGMNFGVRYSYDAGKCTGSNIRLLGACNKTWDTYGFVVGCNNFRDHYPYPLDDTAYPDGIWYSFPGEGKCDNPTGQRNCTWSAEEAGEIRVADLEAAEPGYEHCCMGNCTGFWSNPVWPPRGVWRVQQAMAAFAAKYPDMPQDLPTPACDFERSLFWQMVA